MLADNETSFGTVDTAVDASSPLPSLPSQSTLMGALLIGCYFAVSLYGLITHQMYRYYRMYPNDNSITKVMVGTMLMDTLHSILITHTCYYYLISNYFDPPKLLDGVWSLRISITLTGFIITIAHVFFSRRIHLFSKSLWIPIAIMAISTVRLAFAIATTVVSFDEFTFIKFQGFTWLVCLTLGLDMISDIMITVSLCWFLQRSKTGFEKTDSVIDKLLLYAINTGLLTILFNIAVLICAGIMPDNLIFIGMFFIISKLYTNNLLAVLNSRHSHTHISDHGSFDLQEINHFPALNDNGHSPQVLRRGILSTIPIDVEGSSSIKNQILRSEAGDSSKVTLERRTTIDSYVGTK